RRDGSRQPPRLAARDRQRGGPLPSHWVARRGDRRSSRRSRCARRGRRRDDRRPPPGDARARRRRAAGSRRVRRAGRRLRRRRCVCVYREIRMSLVVHVLYWLASATYVAVVALAFRDAARRPGRGKVALAVALATLALASVTGQANELAHYRLRLVYDIGILAF